MASRSAAFIRAKNQAAFGTAETTGLTTIPILTHSMGQPATQQLDDGTIGAGRFGGIQRAGTIATGGDISVNLAPDVHDILIENAFWNAFSSGTLDQGDTTRRYATIEDGQTDASSYTVFRDCMVNTMRMELGLSSFVRATFGIIGTRATNGTSATASPVASAGDEPFDTFNGSLTLGGSSFCVTSANILINNQLDPRYCLYDRYVNRIVADTVNVTAELTLSLDDNSILTDYLADTEQTNLVIAMAFGGQTYTWTMPALSISDYTSPVTEDAERVQNVTMNAKYNAGITGKIRVVKS